MNFRYFIQSMVTIPQKKFCRTFAFWSRKLPFFAAVIAVMVATSCRSKMETVYRWENGDESRSLTLKRDNSFILEVNAGYYVRIDTGTFLRKGDTLMINPDKGTTAIDSLVEMDSLYYGHRFLEVMQTVFDFGMDNQITGVYHRGVIFPSAVVNDTFTLALDADDPSYRKLYIPDSVEVRSLLIRVPEQRTCKPELTFRLSLPPRDPPTQSYRVYIRSHDTRSHYLAGFKWLVEGDTIMTSFVDDSCTPGDMRLVRVR